MTTSNAVTLDHINAFFSLNEEVEDLNISLTATGGAGINNLSQFPPPKPILPPWRKIGTDYVKKYVDKEKLEESVSRRQTLDIPGGSTISINTLEDIDDTSTLVDQTPVVNELQDATTKQIYAAYFKNPTTYNSDLIISRYREEILQQLEISPVVVIQGATGCGKTTQVPQYILDHCQSRGMYCNIIVTQPRKIAAISIARRVCHERNWDIGTIVGYQVAMDPCVSSDTRLSYVTTGVLLEKLVNAKRMDMYTHVVIDEVHERNQDTDFALLLVKKFLKSNSPRVKVILMSATFDSTEFSKYFSLYQKSGPAPVIDVIGKQKEVIEYYIQELGKLIKKMPEFDLNNPMIDPELYNAVYNLISFFDHVEKQEQGISASEAYAPVRGAVLIFLPGYEEICTLNNRLQAESYNKNFWVIPLHSSITVEEQTKVFQNPPFDHRKIIISTNIAESSITVPDVKYVIDFCLTKNLVTDPTTNYTCLQLEWASKANCIQRKGRAGRVDIGKVYRMVPTSFYNQFQEYGIPEIKRCPLTSTILHLKKLNLCEPQEMLAFALDPPDLSDIGNAILQLKEALALTARASNPFDGDLTFVGRVMANLPLDIKFSKLIIFGYVFHCLEECIIIAASLSLQSFFARPFQEALKAYRSRLAWDEGAFSDCLVYVNAFQIWKRFSQQGKFKRPGGMTEIEWCQKHFIQVKRVKEVDMLVKEIKNRLEKLQIRTVNYHHSEDEKLALILKMVIAGAFFPHYFLQEPLDEKTIMRDINDNNPRTTVHVSGLPSKHGILYAAALKEMFTCCHDNITLEFEESKAYITFGQNVNTPSSNVLQAVYLAVKMRKLRMPLELAVFSSEEAERKSEQILSSKLNQWKNSNTLMSNRVTVKPQSEIKKVALPPLDKTIIKIFISHLNNCGSFWARQTNSETSNHLRFLETIINCDKGKNLEPLTGPPEANMLYLAPYVQYFYRAQVQKIFPDKSAKVFFIDYGNEEIVKLSDLRKINCLTMTDVLTTPALAIECSLSGIKPFRSLTGKWSDRANEWFKEKINGIELDAEVYSFVQDKLRLKLMRIDRNGLVFNFNEELVKLGLAEVAEESFASKQNHELRIKARGYSVDQRVCESLTNDLAVSWEEAAECKTLLTTGKKIRLHGPYNPLEVSYSGMTNLDRCKCVKVERESVNSVSFNADPEEPYTAMLVAASLGVGQSSHDLIARNTTLMPKIRGLPTLICLLFTPYAEIRTDKERSSYTGAICGLGYDPRTGESIYPDHDIELAFDIQMTLEDIREINAIRMGFNLLLHSQSEVLEFESAQARNVHDKTRKTILQLLQRPRKSKVTEYYRNPYKWNQIPIDFILDTEVDQRADHPDVFPLHKPSSLKKYQSKDMITHLDQLYQLVDGPTNSDFKLIRCELCSMDVTSERDLLIHLDSKKHQQKEKLCRQK